MSPSSVVTERIPAIAPSDMSVSTVIRRFGAQWARTGADPKASFRSRKALTSSTPKCQGMDFLQRWLRGWVISRSEEHTSELQSLRHLVCRLLLEKKNILATV